MDGLDVVFVQPSATYTHERAYYIEGLVVLGCVCVCAENKKVVGSPSVHTHTHTYVGIDGEQRGEEGLLYPAAVTDEETRAGGLGKRERRLAMAAVAEERHVAARARQK